MGISFPAANGCLRGQPRRRQVGWGRATAVHQICQAIVVDWRCQSQSQSQSHIPSCCQRTCARRLGPSGSSTTTLSPIASGLIAPLWSGWTTTYDPSSAGQSWVPANGLQKNLAFPNLGGRAQIGSVRQRRIAANRHCQTRCRCHTGRRLLADGHGRYVRTAQRRCDRAGSTNRPGISESSPWTPCTRKLRYS